jgi:integrase
LPESAFQSRAQARLHIQEPVSRVEFLPEKNEQTLVLTYDEQSKYLSVATPMLRDVATLTLEAGMRPEEVYRIKPENVNLAGGFLVIPTARRRRRVDGFPSPHRRGASWGCVWLRMRHFSSRARRTRSGQYRRSITPMIAP